jgi:hypothetical protein
VLSASILTVLAQAAGPMKACDINNQVALFLQIPQDIPEIEDANYAGSEFA